MPPFEFKWTSFEKRNNLDEQINIRIKTEESGFVIQISFKRHNPCQILQLIYDPLCFQNPRIRAIYRTYPQSVRFLRPNPSIRKPIHPTPPGSLDVGVPSLPSSFETSSYSTLSTGANFRSPRWTAVWYMFRGRVPAFYTWWFLVWRTWSASAMHYGRNRRNRGWKWWLAEGEQKPDQPRCRSITGINHVVRVTQCSRRIKHLFFVSRKIILQNHASRLLWKSRFTWKKFAISRFTRKKGPITSHENTLYDPRKYTPSRLTIRIRTFVQSVIAAFFETFHFQLIVNLELTKLSRIA